MEEKKTNVNTAKTKKIENMPADNAGKDKKKLIIIGAIILAVIAALVITLIIILGQNKEAAYRIIKVYEVQGEAVVNNESKGEIEAYENMVLESGDTITVGEGKLTLKLDEDKYLYAESNTTFELLASGTPKDSKTTINLIDGKIANEIQNKLSDDSYYEINTPNSTMSVRGTIYYVETYVDTDGRRYTKVSVFDGAVDTDLIFADGTKGNNKLVEKGKEIIIYTDEDEAITDYLFEDTRDIIYDELPVGVIETLREINEEHSDGDSKRIDLPDDVTGATEEIKGGPYTVTFMYGDQVFATVTVEWGEKVAKPKLQPAPTGKWDYDFNLPVKDNIVISWQ